VITYGNKSMRLKLPVASRFRSSPASGASPGADERSPRDCIPIIFRLHFNIIL
jgi:hypothetical protein